MNGGIGLLVLGRVDRDRDPDRFSGSGLRKNFGTGYPDPEFSTVGFGIGIGISRN
jgi:hypothetical protein